MSKMNVCLVKGGSSGFTVAYKDISGDYEHYTSKTVESVSFKDLTSQFNIVGQMRYSHDTTTEYATEMESWLKGYRFVKASDLVELLPRVQENFLLSNSYLALPWNNPEAEPSPNPYFPGGLPVNNDRYGIDLEGDVGRFFVVEEKFTL